MLDDSITQPPSSAISPVYSPYITFSRESWALRRADTPLTLNEEDLKHVRGINSPISLNEVEEIYLPVARLLNMYITATRDLYRQTAEFLGHPEKRVPYVIGLAGSVAVGKSTASRTLQALLARGPNHPNVALVTTDGFLLPNAELDRRGIMDKKGFPESYDQRALLNFVSNIKAGVPRVMSPVYSHQTYDILPDAVDVIEEPDIVIIEGLNVLQSGSSRTFVSDFFDFSIYIHAEPERLLSWYIARFLKLRDTSFQQEDSYFKRYSALSDEEARALATSIWETINAPNLLQNIEPTRERADLILYKGEDHVVERIDLRKL